MPSRHRARQRALQILFQWDLRKQPVEESLESFFTALHSEESNAPLRRDEFIETLVRGTAENVPDIDSRITRHAEHWKIERMPAVDRNILRLAVYEIVHTETPPAVVIDEALELARRYSSEESVQFVNGVLDAVKRETVR